jgi:hypothetical protein
LKTISYTSFGQRFTLILGIGDEKEALPLVKNCLYLKNIKNIMLFFCEGLSKVAHWGKKH